MSDDSEWTNEDRALRAQAALDAYICHTGDVTDEAHFRDLLTDMMHLADDMQINFLEEFTSAQRRYSEEIDEEEDPEDETIPGDLDDKEGKE